MCQLESDVCRLQRFPGDEMNRMRFIKINHWQKQNVTQGRRIHFLYVLNMISSGISCS